MKTKFIKKEITYTGRELSSLFAYKNFDLQGDSLIAFCGPCLVEVADLADQADVKTGSFIKSERMVHFIVEKFELDLAEGVYRQRLYMSIIKEIIEELATVKVVRRGDDLFVKNKKLSVSIAVLSPVSTMIHIGINISAKEAPVPAIGLSNLGIDEKVFIQKFLSAAAGEEEEIYLARCKVKGVK